MFPISWFDLSESVYAFSNYLTSTNATLVRASGTDLPLVESVVLLQFVGEYSTTWMTQKAG